jgi:hypothetical protein
VNLAPPMPNDLKKIMDHRVIEWVKIIDYYVRIPGCKTRITYKLHLPEYRLGMTP